MSSSALPPPAGLPTGVDDGTRLILEFERSGAWRGRTKDRAIRERLGITPTRYHQLLLGAIDRPEVLAYDPMLVHRLRRLRDARRRIRRARKLGHPLTHG